MAIAKELDTVDPQFIQKCPLCERENRIVMNGLFVIGSKVEKHPDMGYSFCNCKNIFYTNRENLRDEVLLKPDDNDIITYPDPFFAWANPYDFLYWNPRKYHIIWDMFSLVETLTEWGFQVDGYCRDFNLESKTPQHFHIKVSK